MSRYKESIEIDAPVEQIYQHWCDFERYPEFLSGVEAVRRIGERRLAWRANIGGEECDLEVVITEQRPNRRIAWASHGSPHIAGSVELAPHGERSTRLTLTRETEVEDFWDNLQTKLTARPSRLRADLQRFKLYAETAALGVWSQSLRDIAAHEMARVLGIFLPIPNPSPGGYSVAAPDPAPLSGPGIEPPDTGSMGGGGGSFGGSPESDISAASDERPEPPRQEQL